MANELLTCSTTAVVFEALQLWQLCLEFKSDKIPDFGRYYGYHPIWLLWIDSKALIVHILQLSLTLVALSLCLPAALWSYSQRCLSTPTGESFPSA